MIKNYMLTIRAAFIGAITSGSLMALLSLDPLAGMVIGGAATGYVGALQKQT